VAAGLSMAVATALGVTDPYWSPITTIIVTQSGVVDSWLISRRRLLGTLLGVILGALQVLLLPRSVFSYGLAILLLGLVCGFCRIHQSAYRFGGIALTIVIAAAPGDAVWRVALFRFVDVAIGIGVALAITRLWPEAVPPGEPR
jgi:uncharacterized membrane protein YgaE (UPF0421/DUF939 family)